MAQLADPGAWNSVFCDYLWNSVLSLACSGSGCAEEKLLYTAVMNFEARPCQISACLQVCRNVVAHGEQVSQIFCPVSKQIPWRSLSFVRESNFTRALTGGNNARESTVKAKTQRDINMVCKLEVHASLCHRVRIRHGCRHARVVMCLGGADAPTSASAEAEPHSRNAATAFRRPAALKCCLDCAVFHTVSSDLPTLGH